MTARTKSATEIDSIVGANIRAVRNLRKISQEGLAAPLGLTFQQIQKYENGANRIGASRLHQIATVLEVPVAELFQRTPPTCADDSVMDELMATGHDEIKLLESFRDIPDRDLRHAVQGAVRAMADVYAKHGAARTQDEGDAAAAPMALQS